MPAYINRFNRILIAGLIAAHVHAALPAQAQTTTEPYVYPQQDAAAIDMEYGVIGYTSTPRSDPVANLDLSGLRLHPERGYLDALLESLAIDPSSQILVFSRTSLNVTHITPQTPRAIYFNDTTYVAMVPGSNIIEIASMDPKLGPVFYTLDQDQRSGARIDIQTGDCLRCHDSYSMTGGGVPRFILGSGYIGANGNLVSHEGWILTTTGTQLKFRWGGWYVTGKHGKQVHLGNFAVNDPSELNQLDNLRKGNIDNLETMIDTSPYLTRYSDIVALMVIEHQVEFQNMVTRVNYDIRNALHDNPALLADAGQDIRKAPDSVRQLVRDISEPLVNSMLMGNETPLTDTISGGSGFTEWFSAQGPRDSQQRSLRELDLKTRLFRYPLSYLIYSAAFDNLPLLVKQHIYLRLSDILTANTSTELQHLSMDNRQAILEILKETKPDFNALMRQ